MATPMRDLRAKKLLSQAKLAQRARVSINTINRAENHPEHIPNVVTQERIARALGVDRRLIWPDELPSEKAAV